MCVHDHLLGYIREAKTPKEAWENLKKIFAVNTMARKLQLRQELNNIQQTDMSASTLTSAYNPEDVWLVDSGASNHMMSHQEWFRDLRELDRPGYVETKDDTTAIYLMNWCTTSGVHEVSPHEKHYGNKQNLSHVRIFGSIAYVHIPDEKRRKLDPKSEKCILVGYSLEQKGYKCFNPSTRKFRVSRDVVFDESTSWYKLEATAPEPYTADLNNTEDNNQLRSIGGQYPRRVRSQPD